MRARLRGKLLSVNEDPLRDKTELLVKVRTSKLLKLGVEPRSKVGKENSIIITIAD
jgi:hypothetical protein